jgi:5-methylcytosine-specific restriction endonuclease McrBC GTP-binding regulatory subunit McrB
MNLARVEYYFADFLSLLELPNSDEWQLEIVAEQQIGDPVHLKEGKIRIPENMWFIGTANNDDSTFAITDKVYDRASSISMNEKAVPFSGIDLPKITISYQYLKDLFDQALSTYQISKVHMDAIYKLDNHISKVFQITFGNRIMKQLETFVPVYVACGREEIEAIDYIIARKIIRKFETLNLPFMKKELEELVSLFDSLFGKNKLIESKTMILKFITQV